MRMRPPPSSPDSGGLGGSGSGSGDSSKQPFKTASKPLTDRQAWKAAKWKMPNTKAQPPQFSQTIPGGSFVKKITSFLRRSDDSVTVTHRIPGETKGTGKGYEKTIDKDGKTKLDSDGFSVTKTTWLWGKKGAVKKS